MKFEDLETLKEDDERIAIAIEAQRMAQLTWMQHKPAEPTNEEDAAYDSWVKQDEDLCRLVCITTEIVGHTIPKTKNGWRTKAICLLNAIESDDCLDEIIECIEALKVVERRREMPEAAE
jgi:hypothetical protein